jgi:hypothetical protein
MDLLAGVLIALEESDPFARGRRAGGRIALPGPLALAQ